jgi:MFS family permease
MPWGHPAGRSLALAFAVHAVLVGTWAGRVPAIKHALHLSDSRLGVALFGMAAGTLLGSWWGGHLARRLGPTLVVRAGIPAMAAALVSAALAGSLAGLTAALVLFGTIGAIVDVGMNSLAVAAERDRRRPQMSGFHAAWSIGLLVGALAASAAAAVDLRPSVHFAIVGLAVTAGSAIVLARIPGGALPRPAGSRSGRAPWTAGLVALGLVAFCSFFAEGAAADWSAVYLHDRAGAGAAVAAAAFAGFSLAMAASRLVGDHLVARFGPVGIARRASLVAATGLAIALAVPIPAAGVAGFALMGAGLAPIVPTILSAAGGSGGGVEAAISRVLLIAYTGSIVGPAAIGFAAGHVPLRAALVIPLGLILCIGAAAGRLRPAAGGDLART